MRTKIIAFLAAVYFSFSAVSLSGCMNKQEIPNEEHQSDRIEVTAASVTRGQWITMLAEAFTLDTYQAESPYYSDITSSNPLFPSVQAAAEWGIFPAFSSDNTFNAEAPITRQEIVDTSLNALGYHTSNSSDYAVRQGIISAGVDLAKNPTLDECEKAIKAAKTLFLEIPDNDTIIVDPNDKLIDFSHIAPTDIETNQGQVILSNAVSEAVQDGDFGLTARIDSGNGIVDVTVGSVLIMAPTAENPRGIAYKVSSISEHDGNIIFSTTTPVLSDLYDELVVHTTTSADLNSIIWDEHVLTTAATGAIQSRANGEYHVNLLSHNSEQPFIIRLDNTVYTNGVSKDFEFANGNFEKSWKKTNTRITDSEQLLETSNFVYDAAPSIDDFNGTTQAWTKSLSLENKFSAGYKITGNITIHALTVTTNVEYHKDTVLLWDVDTLPESAGLQINSDISSSLKLEGNLNERLKIATIPIPVAATGLVVSVDLYLFADASGELQVKAELGSSARADWNAPSNVKATAESHVSADATAAIDIEFGAELAASLNAFGTVTIMDVGVKAGGDIEASAYVGGKCEVTMEDGVTTRNYTESISVKSKLYVPVVNLYVGSSDSLVERVGISKEWNIAGKDNGAESHSLIDKEWVIWSKIVQIGADGKPIGGALSNTYRTKFAEENRTGGAVFEFDYPDNWKITVEDVSLDKESVTLTRDNGAHIVFFEIPENISIEGGGSGVIMYRADITKIDDSALNGFMVAHIERTIYDRLTGDEHTAPAMYAVLPSNRVGEQWDNRADMGAFSFDYTGHISFIAYSAANTHFSDEETAEVLAILSSFRAFNENEPPASAVDFLTYAGTYRLIDASPFNNYYGIPTEITLKSDGAISGDASFPDTAPLYIEQNDAGAICCVVTREEKAGRGSDQSPFSYNGKFYIICPKTVSSAYADAVGYDQITGTDTVRIRLVSVGGGIRDIMYSK